MLYEFKQDDVHCTEADIIYCQERRRSGVVLISLFFRFFFLFFQASVRLARLPFSIIFKASTFTSRALPCLTRWLILRTGTATAHCPLRPHPRATASGSRFSLHLGPLLHRRPSVQHSVYGDRQVGKNLRILRNMSSKNEDGGAQDAAERIKAAALSAAKGLSRAQAERAATAAARNVNAYGQKEEGPSRWQERKEAKRQMYLMSTEKQVRLGERKDLKTSMSSMGAASQCQKCFQTDHWTYECKNERVYISRPSRTQQLKNPKLRMKVSISYELENPDIEKDGKKEEKVKKKSKRKHKSDNESGSDDSEASVFESDSGAGTNSSSGGSETSYSSSTDSEEERRRKRRKKKKKKLEQRKRRQRRYSSTSESSDSSSDSESDRSSRKKSSRRQSRRR
ncbi:PREDICTED: NF-kappa-B-activating protein-like [Ipomoea nil]|uniref:NF-kappa-B-activating protein-like n=1 Tax=Ipomoea nil TaxID=35883 RepID=UPI000900CC8D|nr:PREDICTED: NF-kappa-B-activating protein-like [Ipomoea nil]